MRGHCSDCCFWQPWDEEAEGGSIFGECHRHAPTLVDSEDSDHYAIWPVTTKKDWCGEGGYEIKEGEDE